MTAKAARKPARSAARKSGPSPAELKRQVANEKAKADQAMAAANDAVRETQEMKGTLNAMMEKLDAMSKVTSIKDVMGNHDPSQMAIGQVLNEVVADDIPPRPDQKLPEHLAKIKRAMDNPVTKTGTFDSQEVEPGRFHDRPMNSEGPAHESIPSLAIVDQGIDINGKRWTKDKLEMEAFMHETVLVKIQGSTNPEENPLPEIIVNGVMQLFERDKPQWVKRKFIERLARAKKTVYSQKDFIDANGIKKIVMVPNNVPVYPFQILQDTKQGNDWLRRILAEAV